MAENYKKILFGTGAVLLAVLSVYFVVRIVADIDSMNAAPGGTEHTISVSGHGEAQAVPDIANVSFTLREEAATVKEAQSKVAAIEKKVLDALRADGVAEKDIKTVSASFNPKYQYTYAKSMIPCPYSVCPPPGKSVIVGYEAYESINVKVRNIDNVGKIIQDLGSSGASNLSGPNFAVDKEDALKVEARKKAIEAAKEKAEALSRELGVRLGKVVNFSESSGPYPIMYGAAMSAAKVETSAPARLPAGENTITSDVTITYSIR